MEPESARYEYAITVDTPRRMARAVLAYKLRQRPVVVGAVFYLFVGIALILFGSPKVGGLVLISALVVPLIPVLRIRRLTERLRAGGFLPGTLVCVEYEPTEFVLRAQGGEVTHAYADVVSLEMRGDAAMICLDKPTRVVALPAELVPERERGRFERPADR
ncbi:MAG: hypothetical protein ABI345_00520 [Jatrophihabitans sp.]